MPTTPMTGLIHDLRQAVLRDGGAMTDAQLLERFIQQRDEAALAALVQRHGAMVWGVCRRILRSHHDAEDAFQATFLVLVRKAPSIVCKELIANWLYGVAQQTALRARAAAAKREGRERQVSDMPEYAAGPDASWESIQPVLDEEINRLPEKYRAVLLLCDLEDKTRKQAAEELACPEGTVAGRLARARTMLAKRLTQRGITASAGTLATLLSAHAASAAPPSTLVSGAIQAMALYATGQATAAAISAQAVALSEGVLKAMLLSKLKLTAVFLFVFTLLTVGGGVIAYATSADSGEEPPTPVQNHPTQLVTEQDRAQRPKAKDGSTVTGKIDSVDVEKNSVTLAMFKRGVGATTTTYTLAKDAKILRGGKEIKLAELKSGTQAVCKLAADEKSVVSISVDNPLVSAALKSVDTVKNTITINIGMRGAKEDKTYQVAKDARISIDRKDAKLGDLKEGSTLLLSITGANTVTEIRTASRKDRKQD